MTSTDTEEREVLTAEEVADLLRFTPAQVRRLAASNDLPGAKIGGSWRFRRSAIVELIPGGAA